MTGRLTRAAQMVVEEAIRDDEDVEILKALVEISTRAQAAAKYVHCVTEPPCGDCDACRFHKALDRLDTE